MTLQQAIEFGIAMGMQTFNVRHYLHHCGSAQKYWQDGETIFDFIKGYENCIVVNCYFGTAYRETIPTTYFPRPYHCVINYRLPDEELPTMPCN